MLLQHSAPPSAVVIRHIRQSGRCPVDMQQNTDTFCDELQLQLQFPLSMGHVTGRAQEDAGGQAVHWRHSRAVHWPQQGLCLHRQRRHQVHSHAACFAPAVPDGKLLSV